MRSLPIVAVVAASLGLAACTVNNPPPAAPAAVVTPVPTVVTPAPMAPAGTAVIVR